MFCCITDQAASFSVSLCLRRKRGLSGFSTFHSELNRIVPVFFLCWWRQLLYVSVFFTSCGCAYRAVPKLWPLNDGMSLIDASLASLLLGAGTYTTSSLSTKTASTSDPPNICKVKPQQLQTSSLASASHFSQLSCMPSLIAQQQQSPQVYVSQSAAGNGVCGWEATRLLCLEFWSWRVKFGSGFSLQ